MQCAALDAAAITVDAAAIIVAASIGCLSKKGGSSLAQDGNWAWVPCPCASRSNSQAALATHECVTAARQVRGGKDVARLIHFPPPCAPMRRRDPAGSRKCKGAGHAVGRSGEKPVAGWQQKERPCREQKVPGEE